jgi:hypothetical protein
MAFLMLVVLLALTVAALPRWEYSRNWNYLPSGTLGTFVALIVVLLLLGRI